MLKPHIGVIGGGTYGTFILDAFYYRHCKGDIELCALAEKDEARLGDKCKKYGLKGYQDYKEMIAQEKLDAVAVVTPDYLHRDVVLYCAENKLNMLVEKPLDTTSSGAQQMIDAAKENNVLMFVDFHKRYDNAHRQLRKMIAENKLGSLQYGYACMEDKILVPSVWFKKWAHNSSPVWFLGVHFYDLIYFLIQKKPVRVYATGVKKKLLSMGIDSYDSVQAKIEFEDDITFTVDSSWILPNNFSCIVNQQIRVVGSDGVVEADSEDRGMDYAFESSGEGFRTSNPFSGLLLDKEGFRNVPTGYVYDSMYHFLDLEIMLKNGKKLTDVEGLYPNGDEAIIATKIAEAVHRSVLSGQIEYIDA